MKNQILIFIVCITFCNANKCKWNNESLILFNHKFEINKNIVCIDKGEWGTSRSPCNIDKSGIAGFKDIIIYGCESKSIIREDSIIKINECKMNDFSRENTYSSRLNTKHYINCICNNENEIQSCKLYIKAQFKKNQQDFHPVTNIFLNVFLFFCIVIGMNLLYYQTTYTILFIYLIFVFFIDEKILLSFNTYKSTVIIN